MNQKTDAMAETPEFLCNLSVHAGHGYLDESRMKLLQEIQKSGTLTAAAEAMKVSYKTAWSWLDAMGNAAEGPLVESVQGGATGGATSLTPLGEKILFQYNTLCDRHARFMASLQTSQQQQLRDVESFMRRLSMNTSARNQLHGTIERIWGDKTQAWVDVMVADLAIVTARVTRSTVREMGLDMGVEVTTLTKATCLTLTRPDHRPKLSKGPINRIKGVLTRGVVDEDYALATLEIAGLRTLTALVPIDTWQNMDPRVGEEFTAWFEPDHVILARNN